MASERADLIWSLIGRSDLAPLIVILILLLIVIPPLLLINTMCELVTSERAHLGPSFHTHAHHGHHHQGHPIIIIIMILITV